jgi:hypothetical protein
MSDMSEEWRWIKGYENLYMISNLGRIKSFHIKAKGLIRSLKNCRGDYLRLPLTDAKGILKTALVHRLVAATFIGEIPPGYEVHHIDGNKQNNMVENLQIIKTREHYFETLKSNPKIVTGMVEYNKKIKPKPINQYSLNGVLITQFPNAKSASEVTGVCARNILMVANKTPFNKKGNIRKQAGGYIWCFAEKER